jgi:hypothetical protein
MAAIMTRTTMAAPPMPRTKGGMVRPSGLSVSEPEGKKPLFKVFRIRPDQGKTEKFPVKKFNIFLTTKCFSDQ